jgi:TolB-like protein/DNA-binding winged helix-turn-helix (wHTH) protein/Flp pilus assembly protein TadD
LFLIAVIGRHMHPQVTKRYILDEYLLEPETRLLRRGVTTIPLPKRPFQVLLYLIDHRDRLVSRAELLDLFWEGRDVYDVTLTKCVGKIRRALGEDHEGPRFIETRYAEGYRFIGPLEEQSVRNEPAAFEVERTRGLKIIAEEEEVHESDPPAENTEAIQAAGVIVTHDTPAPSSLKIPMALAFIAVSLVIGAGIALRIRAGSMSDAQASQAALKPDNSIAVLPFKNLSGDAAQDYLSDGLTESLITELSKTKGLKVISRSSAFVFKDKEIDPREVGQKLGVAQILEGSVRKSNGDLRVEVRLVSAQDGHVLWASETHDHPLKDIFLVQDQIACDVTSHLRNLLCGSTTAQTPHTVNPAAYEAYLKARYFWNKRTGDGVQRAIPYFEQAVTLDPNYAMAYAGLSECYAVGMWLVPFEPKNATAKLKTAALQAVALDENLAEAHAAMASVYFYEWDWAKAGQEYRRAVELNPGSAMLHHNYGLYLNVVKRPDEAIEESKKARELDPLSLAINTDLGLAYQYARKYDYAIEVYRKSLELDPTFDMTHYYLGEAYMMKGLYADALAEFQKTTGMSHGQPYHLTDLGLAYAYSGKTDEAYKTLDQLTKLSKREYVSPYYIANVDAALGEKEKAFFWLEQAYKERAPNLVDLLIDPAFDPLRADPRFADLLQRVGFSG